MDFRDLGTTYQTPTPLVPGQYVYGHKSISQMLLRFALIAKERRVEDRSAQTFPYFLPYSNLANVLGKPPLPYPEAYFGTSQYRVDPRMKDGLLAKIKKRS